MIQNLPDGWSVEKLTAFNVFISGLTDAYIFRQVLTALGLQNDPLLSQARTDIESVVKAQLQAFRVMV